MKQYQVREQRPSKPSLEGDGRFSRLNRPGNVTSPRSAGGRRFWLVGILGAVLLAALLPAVAAAAPPSPLDPASFKAEQSRNIYMFAFWIALVIFVLVELALVYAIIRFRRRDPDHIPYQREGNTTLEIIWTVAPALILVVLFGYMWQILQNTRVPQETTLQVNVVGKQWWWEFEYPEQGFITGNELHIPVGQPVRLEMTSDNVIHSFWVPRLSGKMDVVPGRTNITWIQADQPGDYRGICAELCGAQHANMTFRVVAHPQADYQAWLTNQQAPPVEPAEGSLAAQGKAVFLESGCIACHAIDGTIAQSRIGPNLTHFAARETIAGLVNFENNPENLRRWIANPQDPHLKPGNQMTNLYLPPEDINAIVEYLSSLE